MTTGQGQDRTRAGQYKGSTGQEQDRTRAGQDKGKDRRGQGLRKRESDEAGPQENSEPGRERDVLYEYIDTGRERY